MKTMRKIVQIFITAFSISGVFAASSCTSSRQRCLVIFEMIKAKTFSDVFNITLYDFNKKKTTKLQDFETYNYM